MADDMRYPAAVAENVAGRMREVADELDESWEPVMTSRNVAVMLLRLADLLEAGTEKDEAA